MCGMGKTRTRAKFHLLIAVFKNDEILQKEKKF